MELGGSGRRGRRREGTQSNPIHQYPTNRIPCGSPISIPLVISVSGFHISTNPNVHGLKRNVNTAEGDFFGTLGSIFHFLERSSLGLIEPQ